MKVIAIVLLVAVAVQAENCQVYRSGLEAIFSKVPKPESLLTPDGVCEDGEGRCSRGSRSLFRSRQQHTSGRPGGPCRSQQCSPSQWWQSPQYSPSPLRPNRLHQESEGTQALALC